MDEPWDDIAKLAGQGLIDVEWSTASILDLGFGGSIGVVLSFYTQYPFFKYVGVDNLPSEVFGTCSSFIRYQRFEQEGGVRLPDITEAEYERRFTRVYDRDIIEHLQGDESQYDFVVLSSILHLPGVKERWKSILTNALRLTKRDGYVYIKVFDRETGYGHFDDSELAEMQSLVDVVVRESGVGSRQQLRLLGRPVAGGSV